MARTHTLSVYLLKPTVGSPRTALRPDLEGVAEHAVAAGETAGTLFVVEGDEHQPDWARLLEGAVAPPLEVRTRTAMAVLLIEAAGRRFAIPFGHGRLLLDPNVYVRNFGLRCALNAVDPERLRALESRTFSEYALHTVRQVSRLTTIEALEIDVQRDLLTSLAGVLQDEDFGKRIAGSHAARLTAAMDIADLADKCAGLLRLSRQTAYRKPFPWIDNIEELTDPAEIASLNSRAFEALGRRRFTRFDLYPPEIVPDEVVRYELQPSRRPRVLVEPDTSLLRDVVPAPVDGQRAREAVQRQRLIGIGDDGLEVASWSVLECLHYEVHERGQLVVLDGGRWYRIRSDFARDVEQFAQRLQPSGLALPGATPGDSEGKYNAATAQARGYALVDTQLVRLAGQTGIEPCDLFTADRHLIHVKKRKGGSGPLSHLYFQAIVSAECLLTVPEFGHELRKILDASVPGAGRWLPEPVRAADCTIVLGLITRSASPGAVAADLPFFSKVALRQAVHRLEAMGFDVRVDEIPTTAAVSKRPPRPPRGRQRGRPVGVPTPRPAPGRPR